MRQHTSSSRGGLGYTRAFPQATTAADFPASVSDALALDSLLTPEERNIRRRVRSFAVSIEKLLCYLPVTADDYIGQDYAEIVCLLQLWGHFQHTSSGRDKGNPYSKHIVMTEVWC